MKKKSFCLFVIFGFHQYVSSEILQPHHVVDDRTVITAPTFFLMQQVEFKTPTEYILKQRKKSLQHDLQETKKERKKIQNETRINQSNLSILLTEVCVLP